MLTHASCRAFYIHEQGCVRTRYFSSRSSLRAFLAHCRRTGVRAWEPPAQTLVTIMFPEPAAAPSPAKKRRDGKVLSSVAMVRARIAGLTVGGMT